MLVALRLVVTLRPAKLRIGCAPPSRQGRGDPLTLRGQLRALNRLWWLEGELEGLAAFGADSIAALSASASPTASERLLAWPRYDRPDDLERLLETWAGVLLDHPERCPCLRHDPEQDGDLVAAIERLQEVYARVIGAERELEVLMVDGAIPEDDLPRLGRAVRGVLSVPGRSDPLRESWEARLGAERFADPAGLSQPSGGSQGPP